MSSPEFYVRAAFEAVGISVSTVEVECYDPDAFGNFIAKVSSAVGDLTVIYDRGFFIDTDESLTLHDRTRDKLVQALEENKKASIH